MPHVVPIRRGTCLLCHVSTLANQNKLILAVEILREHLFEADFVFVFVFFLT